MSSNKRQRSGPAGGQLIALVMALDGGEAPTLQSYGWKGSRFWRQKPLFLVSISQVLIF